MRFQAEDWLRGSVKTDQILLDLDNPRFAYRLLGGLDGVVKYLVEKEGVLELAGKIAAYGGLYDNERIIVWQRNDKEFVVLEGNRRVLACQILLHPGKYFFDDAKVDSIPKIDAATADRIGMLEVSIVSDRRNADPVIANMHVFGKKDWHFLSQMYYAYNSYSLGIDVDSICNGLNCAPKDVYYFLRCYKAIDLARQSASDEFGKIEAILGGEVDFKFFLAITLSPLIQKHFGAPFIWDDGRENFHGHPDLIAKIRVIASHALFGEDQVGHRASRGPIEQYLKFAFRRDDRQMELDDVLQPAPYKPRPTANSTSDKVTPSSAGPARAAPMVPEDANPISPAAYPELDKADGNAEVIGSAPAELAENDLSPPPQKPSIKEAFFEYLECPVADFRLQQLTKEIVNVSKRSRGLVEFAITASFLARALLEWSMLYQLKRFKKLGDAQAKYKCASGVYPSLSDLLLFCDTINNDEFMPKKLREKCKFIRDHWINDLNCNAHNDFGNHTQHRLSSMASDIRPVVRWIFSGIDETAVAERS